MAIDAAAKTTPRRRATIAPRKQREPLTQVQVGERRRAATRAAMLEAAFSLLGRSLGRTLRVEEVCSEAKVVRTTFYNHFDGIEELVSALGNELSHDFNTAVHLHARQLPSISEQVAAGVRLYLQRARSDRRWGFAMVNLSVMSAIMGHETHQIIEQDVRDGIRLGEFKVPSQRLGADIVHGLGLAAMISILEGAAPEDYPEQVAGQVLRGLGVPARKVERIVAAELPQL